MGKRDQQNFLGNWRTCLQTTKLAGREPPSACCSWWRNLPTGAVSRRQNLVHGWKRRPHSGHKSYSGAPCVFHGEFFLLTTHFLLTSHLKRETYVRENRVLVPALCGVPIATIADAVTWRHSIRQHQSVRSGCSCHAARQCDTTRFLLACVSRFNSPNSFSIKREMSATQ